MINQLTEITLPVVKIGRPTAESKALYQRQLDAEQRIIERLTDAGIL